LMRVDRGVKTSAPSTRLESYRLRWIGDETTLTPPTRSFPGTQPKNVPFAFAVRNLMEQPLSTTEVVVVNDGGIRGLGR